MVGLEVGVVVGRVLGCSFSACPLPLAHPASSNTTLRVRNKRMGFWGSQWGRRGEWGEWE